MTQAIASGEIEVASAAGNSRWIWREELLAKALELWAPEVIEHALGADADAVLPDPIRLIEIRLLLPRYHVALLEHFAEREATTVSAVLARELDAIASSHSDQLAWVADALAWPDAERSALPC